MLVGKLKDRAVVNELGERVPALDVPADIAHRRRAFAVGHPLTEQLFDALEHFGDPDDPLATSRRNTEDRVTAAPIVSHKLARSWFSTCRTQRS